MPDACSLMPAMKQRRGHEKQRLNRQLTESPSEKHQDRERHKTTPIIRQKCPKQQVPVLPLLGKRKTEMRGRKKHLDRRRQSHAPLICFYEGSRKGRLKKQLWSCLHGFSLPPLSCHFFLQSLSGDLEAELAHQEVDSL